MAPTSSTTDPPPPPEDAPRVRTWPIPATGVAILLAFCALHIYEPRFLRAIALQSYDLLLAANATHPVSGQVLLVDIDDDSLKAVGQWPWSRHTVAELANRLWDAQAAALVFDVGFTEPDRLSPAHAFAFWNQALPHLDLSPPSPESLPDFDAEFARALARGPSVLGFHIDPSDVPLSATPDLDALPWRGTYFEKGQGRRFLPQGRGIPNPPIPPLREHARLGCFNATPDPDNIVRRAPLVFAFGPDRVFLSLALEAFRLRLGDPPLGIHYDSQGVAGVVRLQLGPRSIPTDANARLILNFRDARFPSLPAADILRGAFPPDAVRDRIVIVGSSAIGLFDIYSTPVHPELSGAEIQATILDNLLAGDMLVEPRWLFFADLALLLLGGLLLVALVSRTRALVSLLLLLLALSLPAALSLHLLRSHQCVYLPSTLLLAWTSAVIGVSLVKYWQKEVLADFNARLRAVNLQLNREILVRAAAEREAQSARAAALRAAAAKSEFLANMSHEIRTPMNAVIGFCDIALRAASDTKRLDCLAKIGHSARALLRILNDILDFSKLEAGKLSLESAPFNLHLEIEELADLLGPQALRKNIELLVDCPVDLPRTLVGDSLRLRQVLINLTANAIKFTETGSVKLRVETVPPPASAPPEAIGLRFSVQDTGIGLSPEQQARLFQAFQQADASTTRRFGGTGLGLAISQNLVHMMGGEIRIDSREGAGSTFHFTLPFLRPAPAPEPSPPLTPAPTPAPAGLHALRGTRVLLVDDNPLNREIATENMLELGIAVETASNGQEAVDKARSGAWDLILMDVQMPIVSGYEATRSIRELERNGQTRRPRTPIVAMTAHTRPEDMDLCRECGMDGHLQKPLDRIPFLDALVRHIAPDAARPLPPPAPPAPSAAPLPLDESAALDRLRGNRPLLRRLLDDFLRQHQDDPQRIGAALQAGDPDQARRLAHNLKGCSANLGAMRIHETAARLDALLHPPSPAPDPTLLDALHDAFADLRQLLASSPPPPPAPDAPPGAPDALLDALARIAPLLRRGDMHGLDQLEALLPSLPQAGLDAPLLHNLRQAADAFDFARACDLLEPWLSANRAPSAPPPPTQEHPT